MKLGKNIVINAVEYKAGRLSCWMVPNPECDYANLIFLTPRERIIAVEQIFIRHMSDNEINKKVQDTIFRLQYKQKI